MKKENLEELQEKYLKFRSNLKSGIIGASISAAIFLGSGILLDGFAFGAGVMLTFVSIFPLFWCSAFSLAQYEGAKETREKIDCIQSQNEGKSNQKEQHIVEIKSNVESLENTFSKEKGETNTQLDSYREKLGQATKAGAAPVIGEEKASTISEEGTHVKKR